MIMYIHEKIFSKKKITIPYQIWQETNSGFQINFNMISHKSKDQKYFQLSAKSKKRVCHVVELVHTRNSHHSLLHSAFHFISPFPRSSPISFSFLPTQAAFRFHLVSCNFNCHSTALLVAGSFDRISNQIGIEASKPAEHRNEERGKRSRREEKLVGNNLKWQIELVDGTGRKFAEIFGVSNYRHNGRKDWMAEWKWDDGMWLSGYEGNGERLLDCWLGWNSALMQISCCYCCMLISFVGLSASSHADCISIPMSDCPSRIAILCLPPSRFSRSLSLPEPVQDNTSFHSPTWLLDWLRLFPHCLISRFVCGAPIARSSETFELLRWKLFGKERKLRKKDR